MDRPCVSVLTPVYNGEKYLKECIESVLAQDYTNLEYDIVDNCSTDETLAIARSYAKRDRRIRVRTNSVFVNAVDNHNRAFGLVPPQSKYCKVVSADDWIRPVCISTLVGFAEAHPTVGMVGSYQASDNHVKWRGLPLSVGVISGREAARLALLKRIHFFGTPTSVLYRADLIRMRKRFFPHTRSHADTSACYEMLQHCDLGFVHEVLSEERIHAGQWSTKMDAVNAGPVAYLDVLLTYGPLYLSPSEFAERKKQVFDEYYGWLGGCIWKLKGRGFWSFHRSRLREMQYRFEWSKLASAAIRKAASEARNPVTAARKILATVKSTFTPSRDAVVTH